jgi:hypothetical protein
MHFALWGAPFPTVMTEKYAGKLLLRKGVGAVLASKAADGSCEYVVSIDPGGTMLPCEPAKLACG